MVYGIINQIPLLSDTAEQTQSYFYKSALSLCCLVLSSTNYL